MDLNDQQTATKPKRREWKRPQPRMEPEMAIRQGAAAAHAWSKFENRDEAVAFLNTHHDGLGGRPIDIAIESVDGLAAVERAIESSAMEKGAVSPVTTARPSATHGPLSPTD